MVLVYIEVHMNSQNEKKTQKDSFKVSNILCYFLPSHSSVTNGVCELFKYHLANLLNMCDTILEFTQTHRSDSHIVKEQAKKKKAEMLFKPH